MCGSHSGALVPDLHGPVPESGDIEILDTHVSYCDGQPDPSMGSYSCDQGYTAIWREKDTKHTSPNSQASINPKQFTKKKQLRFQIVLVLIGLIHSGNHTIVQHAIKLH